ncbi:hypothetical protein SISNIDRAFT_419270 [Sistotremastrum niveocremeum HHB9708]|uniref:Calcium-channel protein CCH1 n=1 Tax=Sistotremastrum niveocremeum HHB9708 TaxID=1314777 RepID=A0A164NGT5_9AGAM|nr:hypothetical protein SISNIDRAFT_419270 [Sistotremastrum niveocremeum HHB9708]
MDDLDSSDFAPPRPIGGGSGPGKGFSYNLPGPQQSESSLDSPTYSSADDVRLTAPSRGDSDTDIERVATRKRYAQSSPLKKGTDTLRAVGKKMRRVSMRVVNLAAMDMESSMRIQDEDDEQDRREREASAADEPEDVETKISPLRGRTLCFLYPTSSVRLAMYKLLVYHWTEPAILLLIIINTLLLTIQSANTLFLDDPLPRGPLSTWEDIGIFALFCVFTLESFARIVVSGLLLDPAVHLSSIFSNPFHDNPPLPVVISRLTTPFKLSQDQPKPSPIPVLVGGPEKGHARKSTEGFIPDTLKIVIPPLTPIHSRHPSINPAPATFPPPPNPSHPLPSNSTNANPPPMSRRSSSVLPFEFALHAQRSLAHRGVPYLRHSWSRIDAIAVTSFWISFILSAVGVEHTAGLHLGLFRALSVLRCSRLLAVTNGTSTIMRSLKIARPLLANVAYFVIFAMVLFSIVGVQSFNGSFLRQCVMTMPDGNNLTWGQFCGGFVDPHSLNTSAFITASGALSTSSPRGFICPLGQTCVEQDQNPNMGIQSYDNIFTALLQVIVIASVNTWSTDMYDAIDAEFFASSLFYVLGVIVLNFWLLNLFVAVITNTFSSIRSATKKSAFGAHRVKPAQEEWMLADGNSSGSRLTVGGSRRNIVRVVYEKTQLFWPLLVLASVSIQATRTPNRSQGFLDRINFAELVFTLLFDVEILWRFIGHMPDWRLFLSSPSNFLDLFLGLICSAIQIPVIRHAAVYPWLTFFQLARFYRVILVFPRMKPLLLAIFGNFYGLLNMTMFLLLTNFLAALVAVQLFRGDLTPEASMNFSQIYNGFLAMYQIFSSENWTDVLYSAGEAEVPFKQVIVTVVFLSGWFLFANFIILQMFVAVLRENFEVAEESKNGQQAAQYYVAHLGPQQIDDVHSRDWLGWLNPYRYFKDASDVSSGSNGWGPRSSTVGLPFQKSSVETLRMHRRARMLTDVQGNWSSLKTTYSIKTIAALNHFFSGEEQIDHIPLRTMTIKDRRGAMDNIDELEETERYLDILATVAPNASPVQASRDALYDRRQRTARFIAAHPSYDKTLWIFSQTNKLRRTAQSVVKPANGKRIFGRSHSPIAHPIFELIILLAVIGGIVVAGIATPAYRREFYQQHGFIRGSWFDLAEATFVLVLLCEFFVKVLADGFAFTPNAYLKDEWNIVDFIILAGLIVNTISSIVVIGGVNRVTRSLRALRALRLITLIDKNRSTFESLIFAGASRILDAAMLAMLYLVPYAVWGLNIFTGLMYSCNDSSVAGKDQCRDEYVSYVLDSNSVNLGFYAPRVWDNPHTSTSWSFDNFPSSLLILFEIVSLEGWIDVLEAAVGITGHDLQPLTNANQANALFFLFFNLLGAVVILTVFVSVIIGNFSTKTGTAYLTQAQRDWIDLRRLIMRQKPSKRPKTRPVGRFRSWCYDRAVNKHGWWAKMMTFVFVVHILVLMTETFTRGKLRDDFRDDYFLAVICIYALDVSIRFYGLGLRSFLANGWNSFDLIVVIGSAATTIPIRAGSASFSTQQMQKIFLTSIAFKLVQRSNRMNQLFKTSRSSLPVISSLMILWFTLFLFFGILYVEVFGLTRWESAETREENYSTLGRALLMLAFMSTGEGWNQYMHDYALTYPRCTNSSPSEPDSDCGSVGWAFSLFIAWNILSMYIFVNMFTGVVVESFSYVTQQAGGSRSITREEMRSFKKIWAEFANHNTGYLEKRNFIPFFAKLSNCFEVRIYPSELSIANLKKVAHFDEDMDFRSGGRIIDGIDLYKLARALSSIDPAEIRRRRRLYNRLIQEASISTEPGRGLSFTSVLLMISHYTLINDKDALELKEWIRRTEVNKLVKDLVDLERVRGLLKMVYDRRRFLAYREEKAAEVARQQRPDIPAIVVDSLMTTPPSQSRDITLAGLEETPSPTRQTVYSPTTVFAEDGPTPSPSPSSPSFMSILREGSRRVSDVSTRTTDIYDHYV